MGVVVSFEEKKQEAGVAGLVNLVASDMKLVNQLILSTGRFRCRE